MAQLSRWLHPVFPGFRACHSWPRLFALTLLSAFVYTALEWLFIVTKPSFMNVLPLAKKLEILFFTGAVLAVVCAAALLPLLAISRLPALRSRRSEIIALGGLLPAGVMGTLLMLMLDNFTYTIFHFGIASTQGVARGLYALLLLALVVICYRNLLPLLVAQPSGQPRLLYVLLGVMLISLALPLINRDALSKTSRMAQSQSVHPLTHVVLITSDGVSATHLSLYGYQRDTTPNLRQLAASSLVAENAFANANKTSGSIISIYTGKYPSQTRMLYPPDILRGADAYEHLPGILRAAGYHTVQITVPHFADAFTSNVLEGFDISNGQTATTSYVMAALNRHISNDFAYFMYELASRLLDRARHILYIKEMNTSVKIVTDPTRYSDADRMIGLLDLLKDPRQPLFVHIHLLGTHGNKFYPDRQVFSKGKSPETQGVYDDDFYDDSILEFDAQVRQVVDQLSSSGLLDQTLLIIGSDHGSNGAIGGRIPLLMRFPKGEHAGRVTANVQNLDIAPTILDYLGLPIPNWMEGQSLLDLNGVQRPIVTFVPSALLCGSDADGTCILDPNLTRPPFYQLNSVVVVYCQNWYRLWLVKKAWTSGAVQGSTSTCPAQGRLAQGDLYQIMIDRLNKDGFDTRSLSVVKIK